MQFFADNWHQRCQTEPGKKAKEKGQPSDVKSTHLNALKTEDIEFVEWTICLIFHNWERVSLFDNKLVLKNTRTPPQYVQHTKGLSGYSRSKNRFLQTQGNYQQESVV